MRSFCISLPETPERTQRAREHFSAIGLEVHFIQGVHAKTFGLLTSRTYDYDDAKSGYHIPAKHVGLCLSHYIAWSICAALPDDRFLILEDDALFEDGWRKRMDQALLDVPQDWDMLFIGSCNCTGKPTIHTSGEVFDVRYCQCTHAYIVTPKGIQILLETQRDIFAPIDLALIHRSFEKMRVYTVLPRIVNQHGQEIGA
jgi:GR25 family glycosyltransferase involved in LPS biosynthesis